MSRGQVAAILFDFDHTLGMAHLLEEGVMRDLAVQYGGRAPTNVELASGLRCFRHGQCSLGAMLDSVMRATGADAPANVEAQFRARCLSLADTSTVAMPGAVELLGELRSRGVPNGILTNGWTELQRAKASAIGYEGSVVVSEEIGFWKPDPRAFAAACESFSYTPGTTMYVGDSPDTDVVGSKAAGLIGCWADIEGKTYPAECVSPDVTVTWLPDVLKLL